MIELRGVNKTFIKKNDYVEAVRKIDLLVNDGSIVALIGPSGCGKSTLLNLIAGLYLPTSGWVIYNGSVVTDVNLAVGYMTQKDNIFPWRTTRDNIALPLELAGCSRLERGREAEKVLKRVGLEGFETKYPSELSGGMRKRVCLARMLLYQPETLLLDEPFAALDSQLKLAMHDLLLKLWSESQQTIIFVTHDLMEAITLADRVLVLTKRPAQIIFEQDIYLPRPRDVFNIRFTEQFKEIYDVLWDRLRQEYGEENL